MGHRRAEVMTVEKVVEVTEAQADMLAQLPAQLAMTGAASNPEEAVADKPDQHPTPGATEDVAANKADNQGTTVAVADAIAARYLIQNIFLIPELVDKHRVDLWVAAKLNNDQKPSHSPSLYTHGTNLHDNH